MRIKYSPIIEEIDISCSFKCSRTSRGSDTPWGVCLIHLEFTCVIVKIEVVLSVHETYLTYQFFCLRLSIDIPFYDVHSATS